MILIENICSFSGISLQVAVLLQCHPFVTQLFLSVVKKTLIELVCLSIGVKWHQESHARFVEMIARSWRMNSAVWSMLLQKGIP
jgi:hypothetical protein